LQFYNNQYLVDSTNKYSFFKDKPLTPKDFPTVWKKKHRRIACPDEKEFNIKIVKATNQDFATVQLWHTESTWDPVASVSLQTIPYNCGAINISNLYCSTFIQTGLGWHLLALVEQFLKEAGYTFIFGNTAGAQNHLIPKFEKIGWKQMAESYINPRSDNTNTWLYKIINDQTNLPQPNDEEEETD